MSKEIILELKKEKNGMSNELQVSIHFLDLILANGGEMTPAAVAELFEIHAGNKKIIKKHLKAIINIMKRALKDLEGKDGKQSNN